MLDKRITENYLAILHEELVPAMGCTEPISLAFAAAIARRALGALPEKTLVTVSGNIIKNVKSVIVPHTGGLRGIPAAVAAGLVAGKAEKLLEVLSDVTQAEIAAIGAYLAQTEIAVVQSESDRLFEIFLQVQKGTRCATVTIEDGHTSVTKVTLDGKILYACQHTEGKKVGANRGLLTVENIVLFAEQVEPQQVQDVLERQIQYNTAIAKEGLTGKYGAGIGKILMCTNGRSVYNRAKAWAAAGSDARMNGCELPVVINSGSGNQGMTASLPVIVYAEELHVPREELYRALVVSNLVTVHLKSGIGCLSAYCGAISAGCGAGAGIAYLYGGRFSEIAHTIVNALAINSGVVCDGAKASCAAKIASAVDAGLIGMYMNQHDRQFCGGDGLVKKGIENTIQNISALARDGMRETDREILRIMMSC